MTIYDYRLRLPSQQFLPLKIGIRTPDLYSPHLPQFNIFLFAKASLLFGRPIFAVAWTTQASHVCRMRPRPFQITHRGEQALWAKARAIGECQEAPEDLFEMPDNALTNDVTPQNASIKVRPEAAPEAAPRSSPHGAHIHKEHQHQHQKHLGWKTSRLSVVPLPRYRKPASTVQDARVPDSLSLDFPRCACVSSYSGRVHVGSSASFFSFFFPLCLLLFVLLLTRAVCWSVSFVSSPRLWLAGMLGM